MIGCRYDATECEVLGKVQMNVRVYNEGRVCDSISQYFPPYSHLGCLEQREKIKLEEKEE